MIVGAGMPVAPIRPLIVNFSGFLGANWPRVRITALLEAS